jgi:hypothetical protein
MNRHHPRRTATAKPRWATAKRQRAPGKLEARVGVLEDKVVAAIRVAASLREDVDKHIALLSDIQGDLAEVRKSAAREEQEASKRRRVAGGKTDKETIASDVKASSTHHDAQVLYQDAVEKLRRAEEVDTRNKSRAAIIEAMRVDLLKREAAVTSREESVDA